MEDYGLSALKTERRLRRIRQGIERFCELASDILRTDKIAPARRMPVNAWLACGGDLMDDGLPSEDEHQIINKLFDLTKQCNTAADEAAKTLEPVIMTTSVYGRAYMSPSPRVDYTRSRDEKAT